MTALDTGTEDLHADIDGGIAVITMNRPDRRNAFSPAMVSALAAVLAQVETDEAVGCVVLTGASGAFCAGGDVKSMATAPAGGGWPVTGRPHPPPAAQPAGHQRPPVAHAQANDRRHRRARGRGGPVPGAGLRPALRGTGCGADHRLRQGRVRRRLRRDIVLTQLVGSSKAKELYYFSERLTAEDAERLGIVNAALPGGRLRAGGHGARRRLAQGPPIAYRYMKENLNRAATGELADCMDLEVTHHVHTGLTEDHRQAAQAFMEKREPRFHGR